MDTLAKANPAMADKFDPDEARRLLGRFLDLDQDVPTHHSLYPLYQQLLSWEDEQERRKRAYAEHLGADKGVSRDEARTMLAIGSLDSDDDYMLVHTRYALRMFLGRGRDPDDRIPRIPGAKSVGSALRDLWLLSHQDHPYADWKLILSEHEFDDLLQQLAKATQEAKARIDSLQASGLHLSILKSREPAKVSLGFRSPYGFMICKLVMDFDLFVRVVKTLAGRNLIGTAEERAMINAQLRLFRAFYERVFRLQNVLRIPAFVSLTREDVRNPRTVEIRDRVQALSEIWPGLPNDVLERRKLPRHARVIYREPVRTSDAKAEDDVNADLLL